ncbi:hypothetical protein ACUR5C_01310 [Aliikangiella sp. IMCC44653]
MSEIKRVAHNQIAPETVVSLLFRLANYSRLDGVSGYLIKFMDEFLVSIITALAIKANRHVKMMIEDLNGDNAPIRLFKAGYRQALTKLTINSA